MSHLLLLFQIEIVCVIDLHTKENLNDRLKAFEEVKSACEELGFRRNEEKVFQIQVLFFSLYYNQMSIITINHDHL